MAAPSLEPPSLHPPLGTPASEWAQETVQAIDPNAGKGVFTDASGNPTTVQASANDIQSAANGHALATHQYAAPGDGGSKTRPMPKLFTDAHGNPTTNPDANGVAGALPSASTSVASTPGAQVPGGWIRSPDSRQQSTFIPETSIYDDVSAALGTVGQAAFSVLPASVVGGLSQNHEQGGANEDSTTPTQAAGPSVNETKPSPQRSSSGLLSRAQGVLSGLLARPASPPTKLPVPDAPTTIDQAALVGGGAVAQIADKLGDNIAAGQDLGGHDPKGVLEEDENAKPEEGARRALPSQEANTAARFMDPDVSTPDTSKPPQDPGVSGPLFPDLQDEGKQGKRKGGNIGSTLSPDLDVQEAASKSNQDFSVPIPGTNGDDPKSPSSPATQSQPAPTSGGPQPILTKVSDSGIKSKLLDAKDVVAAPFAGSRAPVDSNELASSVTAGKDKMSSSVDQSDRSGGANPDGIRTTVNPHTPHTNLPPPREEEHVDGTAVVAAVVTEGANNEDENRDSGGRIIIRGISSHGAGQGNIYASVDGRVSSRTDDNTSPPSSPNKGVSRLWSRNRRSVDEGTTSPGLKTSRSRFSEQEPSNGSDSPSTPGSPSSNRVKVPLKDKIKGEFKIITGKVSRNESKVEQGIALKTGHAPTVEPVSPTTQKH